MTYRMMQGSTTGPTYLKIGQIGNVAVGIKPTVFTPSEAMKVSGHTYVACKLRAAFTTDQINDDKSGVVQLSSKKIFKLPSDALPHIEWESADANRASMSFGVMIPGSFILDDESFDVLLGQIRNGKLSRKIAAHALQMINTPWMLDEDTLTNWLELTFGAICSNLQKKKTLQTSVTKQMNASAGHFVLHTEIISKAFQNLSED